MGWPLRIVFWFFCTEFLLLMRVLYSVPALLALFLLGGLRWYVLGFVPKWAFYAYFSSGMTLLWAMHIGSALSNRGRLRRRFLQRDGLGVPLMQLITRNWRLAILAELVIGGIVLYQLAQQPGWEIFNWGTGLTRYLRRYPWTREHLASYALYAERWIYAHRAQIATWQPIFSLSMMTLWSLLEYGILRVPNLRRRKRETEQFALVTEHVHRTPELPGVKQLADEFEMHGF